MKVDEQNQSVASVIDIGSNTIKFLVAKGPLLTVLDEFTDDTRIGVGMGKSKDVVLQPEAMQCAVECVKRFHERASVHHPAHQMIVATSAVRDATNRDEFISAVKQATGLTVRILSGDEEAQYVGCGVAQDPNIDAHKPFYLMDLGGGSLEILEFNGGHVRQKVSLPLGAVRLKERLVRDPSAPMSDGEISEISEYVTETLFASGFAFRNPGALVGTGGGLTHARFLIGWSEGRPPKESSPIIASEEMRALMKKVCKMTLDERRKLPHLPPSRADIMPVAMVVMTTIMGLATASHIVHSFYNLRYGIAADMLSEKPVTSL